MKLCLLSISTFNVYKHNDEMEHLILVLIPSNTWQENNDSFQSNLISWIDIFKNKLTCRKTDKCHIH